tara:strand:+ start:175 stop:585 length:411 start_codon:yes stop_codon:yes gene_type:complete
MKLALAVKVGDEDVLVRIMLKVKGKLSVGEVADLIQDIHLDHLGGTGHFKVTPIEHSKHTPEYVLFEPSGNPGGVSYIDGYTHFDLLLLTIDSLDRDEELTALASEWGEFAKEIDNLSWEQIPMVDVNKTFPNPFK